jgi:uncharacterized damage-inducible protein DinB
MIEVYKYYARCNQAINRNMVEIISSSDKRPYDLQVSGYYKSIGEILDHYYVSDIVWLNAFRQARESEIHNDAIFAKIPAWGERQFRDIASFREKRDELDSMIVKYVDELRPEDLGKEIERLNTKGQKMRRPTWKALVHMFNHETHHRGQISQILDALGIENDYSNMIRIE